jgi:hypothetical protein
MASRRKKTEKTPTMDSHPQKRRCQWAMYGPHNAVETGLGLGCNKAHYETDRRDRTQNAAAKATQLKQDLKEKDILMEILTSFGARKGKYEEAVAKRREEPAAIGCFAAVPFWVVRESDDKISLRIFIRMFLAKCGHGYLGKMPQQQWAAIQNKALNPVDLIESSVNAKVEALGRRLREVEQAIRDAAHTVEMNEEPIATNN